MENIYKINKTLFENIRDKGFTSFTDVQKNVIKKTTTSLNIFKDPIQEMQKAQIF